MNAFAFALVDVVLRVISTQGGGLMREVEKAKFPTTEMGNK